MTPPTTPIRFGYFLIPNAEAPLLETAQRVERLGLDYVAVQDHPYQRRFVDTWMLLAMIAATTTRLRMFPDVANLPLRHPSIMAKSAATIDLVSGGRFELGLGAGAFWDAIEAFGGNRRSPGESLTALEEAISVMRRIWSSERNLRVEGQHYHLAGAKGGPAPVHPIGIWLGVYGPRALQLTGRVADGWIPSFRGDYDALAEMVERLDDAATAAGRAPGDIRRVLNVNGVVTDGSSQGPLHGPVDRWADELAELATTYRFDTFVFWGEGDDQLERFAEDVVPAVRERVGTATPPAPPPAAPGPR